MIRMKLSHAARVLHGKLYGQDIVFEAVTTDTRKIKLGSLFVALKGKNFDAHNFAEQAKKVGAGALLVNRKLKIALPQIVVSDTRKAFGELSAWVRQQTQARVVALTGSSGKTSVKEMTASILSQCGNTLYTIDNLNNDIGVPMTLLRLTLEHKYAVIELGASQRGEIAWTSKLVHPEAVLVNNLAAAHLDGFRSISGIAKAKGEIYASLPVNGIAIMNADNNDWLNWQYIIGNRKIWQFSLINTTNADFTATNIKAALNSTQFILNTPIGSIDIMLPLIGSHNVANAIAAAALSISVGANLEATKIGLNQIKALPGRLFPIILAKNKLLLDDSYNSNLGSMTAAIKVLSKMPGYRILVVGDMVDLGNKKKSCHIQAGKVTKASSIDYVLSIGRLSHLISKISGKGEHFTKKVSLIKRLKTLVAEKKVITVLVKGSRSTAMEEIVSALKEQDIC